MILATTLYVILATANFTQFTANPPYYDLLAQSFLHGQLHILVDPPSELLALHDPYDPTANLPYRDGIHDLSLYGGRIYLYWGPLPAVVRSVWTLVTGQPLSSVLLHVVPAILAVVGFWVLVRRIAISMGFADISWVGGIAAWSFALSGLILFLVARPSVYHEPLLFAICLILWSWYALYRYLEGGEHSTAWLLVAGLLLVLAGACRITYLLYSAGPFALFAWRAFTSPAESRGARVWAIGVFGLPIAAGTLALTMYNVARFDSPSQFGFAYVLQASSDWHRLGYQRSVQPNPQVILSTMSLYLAAVPTIGVWYPYLPWSFSALTPMPTMVWPFIEAAASGYIAALDLYVELPVVSAFLIYPMALGVWCLPLGWRSARERLSVIDGTFSAVVLLSGMLVFVMVCLHRGVTFRYLSDFLPAFAISGVVGMLWLFRYLGGTATPRGVVLVLFSAVAGAISIGLGMLLAIGSWQAYAPSQVLATRWILDEAVANAGVRLAGVADDWQIGMGRTSWRMEDGRTWAESSLYLRAPAASPVLVVELDSQSHQVLKGAIYVDGERIATPTIQPGRQSVVAGPLRSVAAGAVVRVQVTQIEPDARRGDLLPFRVVAAGLADPATGAAIEETARRKPPHLMLGATGDGWVTDEWLELILGSDIVRQAGVLQLDGDYPADEQSEPLRVTGRAVPSHGLEHEVPVTVAVADHRYQVSVDLTRLPEPTQGVVAIRLTFSPWFVPSELGLSQDSRRLVVRAPDEVTVLPRPGP